MDTRWQARVEDLVSFGHIGHRLYIGRSTFDDTFQIIAPPLTVKSFPRSSFIGPEGALLDDSGPSGMTMQVRSFLQAMADAAWEIGIKPKQLEDSRNELAAVRYHLEDMRQLAGVKK